MKVAVYYSNDDIRIEERPVPRISDGEVLVRMMASGICGTDVMQWYRQQKAPRVLGHEMAGEIVDVGADVDRFRRGDRVFVSHHVPCYACHYCREGNYTACETLHTGNYEPGGFSEYVRVPAPNVKFGTFLLPDRLSFEEATMIEPLACTVLGQKQFALQRGHTVLVIGSGVSGLLHIRMAKLQGARVIATDIDQYRLNKAAESGADHTLHAGAYSADELRKVNDGRLAECVIVCAGSKQAVDHAVSSIDRRGKILFFAVPEGDIALPSVRCWRDEISVSFSYGAGPSELKEAIGLIAQGRLDVKPLLTHRLPLSDAREGFRLVAAAQESLKVVLVPDSAATQALRE
ncbi:MAG: alcohol dehydrogenase catalytic domain-containing protein [Nitrospirae bacterium]|nr:alcohol dehydrogenase catalytic domain-containing protein [Nitrospirota bacterium]